MMIPGAPIGPKGQFLCNKKEINIYKKCRYYGTFHIKIRIGFYKRAFKVPVSLYTNYLKLKLSVY